MGKAMATDTLRVRVARVVRVACDIHSFELVPLDGPSLPGFEPGAHVNVSTPGGHIRQYSLCNDSQETHRYVIAVQREPQGRGGSISMHDAVHAGDCLLVSTPRNTFPLQHARAYLLIAGGIGITPLLAMARALQHTGAAYALHYCTRSPERTAFLEELSAQPFASRVHLHHDGGNPALGLDVGALLATRQPGARLYCCGPGGLMRAVLAAATQHAWPRDKVHFESFSADGITPASSREDSEFEVAIRSTGAVFPVPKGQSVLNVLRRNGLKVPSDCETGSCGTCLTRICDGEPDHRDSFFAGPEPAGQGRMLVCVSRAKSRRLVLDL
jgi:vanillate O-demethylase ferredoxin subunit